MNTSCHTYKSVTAYLSETTFTGTVGSSSENLSHVSHRVPVPVDLSHMATPFWWCVCGASFWGHSKQTHVCVRLLELVCGVRLSYSRGRAHEGELLFVACTKVILKTKVLNKWFWQLNQSIVTLLWHVVDKVILFYQYWCLCNTDLLAPAPCSRKQRADWAQNLQCGQKVSTRLMFGFLMYGQLWLACLWIHTKGPKH